MKARSVRILAGTAGILQGVALVLAGTMIIGQAAVKTVYGYRVSEDMFTIPVAGLLRLLIMALLYGGFLVFLNVTLQKGTAGGSGPAVFVGVGCLLQVLVGFLPAVETMLVARLSGVEALASLSTLNSAISTVTTPFTIVAFALFCVAAGGCYNN